MDVLFLVLSACCVAGQFVLSKCYQQKFVRSAGDLLLFPALTAVPAGLYMFALNGFALSWHGFSSPLALCFALIQTLSLLANVLVVRCGPLSVFSVFMMLGGMLLPYAYGALFLKEPLTPARVVGLVLLLAALALSCLPERRADARRERLRSGAGRPALEAEGAAEGPDRAAETAPSAADGEGETGQPAAAGERKRGRGLFLGLCAAAFVLNGATSILFKVHSGRADALSPYGFQAWGFIFQLALSLAAFGGFRLLARRREPAAPGAEAGKKGAGQMARSFGLAAGYAVISSTGGALNLVSAKTLPASMQYPFLTGGSVLLTTLASVLFFGEKFTPRTALLLGCLLAGTLLFLF